MELEHFVFHDVSFPVEKRNYRVFMILDEKMSPMAICQCEPWNSDMPFLSGLHVAEDRRRQGWASSLLKFVMVQCVTAHKHSLALWCRHENEPAIRLYERFAFERFYRDGDNIFMARLLTASQGADHAIRMRTCPPGGGGK